MVPYNWMNSVNILTRKTKTIPSQAKSQLLEGVETTGGRMVFLNNQLERPATFRNERDDIVRSIWKHIANIMQSLWSGIKGI